MARYLPKTLAKTISYIAYHAPAEYGLFWDPNGTMPWKEFYWALQEDPNLRFVRQSHVQELNYLQIALPFTIEDNLLRLQSQFPVPPYPVAEDVPNRLFYACSRRHFSFASKHGLFSTGRPFLAACADKDLALRTGSRRNPQPFLVEIFAGPAKNDGIVFRSAGSELYLFESIPTEYLQFPPVREEESLRLAGKKKQKLLPKTPRDPSPGSFVVSIDHFQQTLGEKVGRAGTQTSKRDKKGPEWKREARKGKDRWKRSV